MVGRYPPIVECTSCKHTLEALDFGYIEVDRCAGCRGI